jgi:hypothetical protein
MFPRHRIALAVLGLLLSLCGPRVTPAAAKPTDACRSVHLRYDAPEGTAFYNEVMVDQSAGGTYFCACGFNMGYFGIQELVGGKKVVIFSVWEPGPQNDPNAVAEDRRVRLVAKDDKVRTGRFGNEGTGGQSFLDYDWKVGQTYRFFVTARAAGQRTEYAAYFYLPEEKDWKHLATFSTLAGGALVRGDYSFVEDFRRDRVSVTQARRAHYGNGWVRTKDGRWAPLARARFTGDNNPALNIDGGADEDRFFLATGGATENKTARLGDQVDLPERQRTPPEGLPVLKEDEKGK